MKKSSLYSILTTLLLLISLSGFSQLVETDPTFPTAGNPCIIYFDATQGSGGLAGYTGDVYAHTGVITENSSSSSDWKYVQSGWGENVPKCKLTRLADDYYSLDITPTVQQYYGVPSNEEILQMAFVFRSDVEVGGQWLEGKTAEGGDIFVEVYDESLNVTFITPDLYEVVVELNDEIEVEVAATAADKIELYVNDVLIKEENGILLSETIIADEYGKYYVKAIALNDTGMVADSFYYFVRTDPQILPVPEGVVEGVNELDENTVILCLYAPEKEYVFAVGDFSDWELDPLYNMNKSPDSKYYWTQIDNLVSGQEYIFQYIVDGTIRIGDPYAEKTSDPWHDKWIDEDTYPNMLPYPSDKTHNIATVFQTGQEPYNWQHDDFVSPEITDLVVYELLIRDFTEEHTYQSVIDSLQYLKTLGINAIELMPISEFEGNSSWGYNPSYYFAPDKYYGPKNDLKKLIDECHKEDIAVILDIVVNHSFGQSPMVMMYWDSELGIPAANSPWFNQIPKHDYNVGYDMNHESEDTKRWTKRVLEYWLDVYHFDGYRFDLSKGLTQKNTLGNVNEWGQYDPSRVAILEDYADAIWETDEDAYVILEHFADNQEETILINYDMIVWGNMNHPYTEASMGWIPGSNLSWASYKVRGWDQPGNVVYMESHDEERMMYKNVTWGNSSGAYNVQDTTTALSRCELAATFHFTIPGPKMVWMFGELGYDYSIDYNGRVGEKPVRWDYYDDYRRKYLYDIYSTLINLKKEQDVFRSSDFTLTTAGAMKRINITADPMSAVVLGNFDLEDGSIDPHFMHTGKWYEYFSGDSIEVTDVNMDIPLVKGEYRIYTDIKLAQPPLNTGIFNPQKTTEGYSFVYPNPSNAGFHIVCDIESKTNLTIDIYNIQGQSVRTLINQNVSPGTYDYYWDGEDYSGNSLHKGLYFYRITSEQGFNTGKLILQ